MTSVLYIAEVKGGLLLELPTEAEELHLKPGDKVTVKLDLAVEKAPQTTSREETTKPKQLRGRGMLAGVLSSEDFMRRKHEETILEDRPIR